MNKEYILEHLTPEAAAMVSVDLQETVTSTNDLLKAAAAAGAPHGSVMIAERQTKGKGRKGRSFYSPENTGLYLSMLLRPELGAQDALSVTTMTGVAAAEAAEITLSKCGMKPLPCEIKWVNDVLLRGKKIAGILTEGCFLGGRQDQCPDYLVMGIGFNVWEPEGGFPEEIRAVAGTVAEGRPEEGNTVRETLTASFLNAFCRMWNEFTTTGVRTYMEGYRKRSCVLGQTVTLLDADHLPKEGEPPVKVVGIGDEAELIVEYPDGTRKSLSSGEISIRVK